MKGSGINGFEDPPAVGLILLKRLLLASYVVKNAPASEGQQTSGLCGLVSHLQDGMVIRITLPTPWYSPRKRTALLIAVFEAL